jgi:hypothetical protein
VAALFFLTFPAHAIDIAVSSAVPGTQDKAIALALSATSATTGAPAFVSPFVAFLPADSQSRFLAAADREAQGAPFNKIATGVSFALDDESSALIVKQIALRGGSRQQTWPRRRPIAAEAATDHVFEAGLRFRF